MMSKTGIEPIQYVYTKDNNYLTNEQRDFYEENGYLIVRNLVDSELIDECKERFVNMCNKKVFTKGVTAMKDSYLKKLNLHGESAISRIQNIYHDDVFSKYVVYKPILDIVQSIIGPNISCCHSLLINKPPNSEVDASRHPMHQDLFFFPFRPDNYLVACWTAMQTVTKENGCLYVVPKSHKMGLQPHDYPPNVENRIFYGVLDVEKYSPIYLHMKKGDTIFFHTLLLHGSGPNVTQGYRKALTCHYVNNNSIFYMDPKNKEKVYDKEMFEKWGYGKTSYENVENRAFYGVVDADKYSLDYLLMEKGDTVFFHTLLLHGSGPNITKGYRKALTCHYVNSNSNFWIDPKSIYSNMKSEEDIIEKWGYGKTNYADFWKKKCFLVRGSPGKVQGIESKL
ncbi:hypothetical protein FQR65_LT18703 [Abscondita terminalis]|nr:hypothetical protein FQR65_LT18703 [Abscondita terminalis]